MWTYATEEALSTKNAVQEALSEWYETNVQQLEELVYLMRNEMDTVQRMSVVALIVQDVHCRDVVEMLRTRNVESIDDFAWQQQLRYYWAEQDECKIRQVNAVLEYGYEYLGAATRLVITPITDRC